MKKHLPKFALLLFVAVIILTLYACNKQQTKTHANTFQLSTKANLTTVSDLFNVNVGAPIKVQTGKQWIANYNKANRSIAKEYIINSQDLKKILSSNNCVGICLYFALDENEQAQLLPIGINTSGSLMKTEYVNTPSGSINWQTAQQWIANDLGAIDARFFGRNTFNRLFKDPQCTSIRAIEALDEQNKPQLLLINAAINYKDTSTQPGSLMFEDRSNPCPPYCGTTN